jgi:hypothetical protein
MSERTSFLRKVIYITGIAVLLIPLFLLGQPSVKNWATGELLPGGVLARMRKEAGLTQTSIGDIDAAGEAIKLATLGLRPLAAQLLWFKATEAKKREDFAGLSAACEQIAKVEPNFIGVWRYLAWNLSYNCSVEFDDYRDRYAWVIRGVKYLMEGLDFNRKETRLPWDLGMFIARKIGRADEHHEYRTLFKADDEFHRDAPGRGRRDRDNWLVGRGWFNHGLQMVEQGAVLRGQIPQIYNSDPNMCRIDFSEAQEVDGGDNGEPVFDERALESWKQSGIDWHEYGNKEMESMWGIVVRLNDLEPLQDRFKADDKELDGLLTAEAKQQITDEKSAKLTKDEREALLSPPAGRSAEQNALAGMAESKLRVTEFDLAAKVKEPNVQKALTLANEIRSSREKINRIESDRSIVNFEFWRLRCQVEQDPDTINARRLLTEADSDRAEGFEDKAPAKYEESFQLWRTVLDRYPKLLEPGQRVFLDDILDGVEHYSQLGPIRGQFPKKFILQDLIDQDQSHDKLKGLQSPTK